MDFARYLAIASSYHPRPRAYLSAATEFGFIAICVYRYGRWTLLLSWVPIIGDPLTLVAGVMREPLWSFLLIVSLAKTGRYLMVMALTLGWM